MNEQNGSLVFQIYSGLGAFPVSGATIVLTSANSDVYKTLTTDISGKTPPVALSAPPRDLSLEPDSAAVPYGSYRAEISADGYITTVVDGINIFSGINSIEEVALQPKPAGNEKYQVKFSVPGNALEMSEEKNPESIPSERERILTKIFIPEYITVHLGEPSNSSASNVTVSFVYYIKNVASSEIYPTWPDSAIRANIIAQISLALNRVFTEWYRSRGYSFDITNSTAYDQYYVPGRAIYENISAIVDEIFNNYLVKGPYSNPYYAEYCNGSTVSCPGMSQWGTVTLANNGYTPLQILQYYYGNDAYITSTDLIQNIESSYPGETLRLGSSSESVKVIQRQLNRIRINYPAIPAISAVDGIYGSKTQAAVRSFQSIFNLTADGIVGKKTWNKISYVYAAVKKIAELNGEGEILENNAPSSYLSEGSTGQLVKLLQNILRKTSGYYSAVPLITADGVFGRNTKQAVTAFQKYFGLTADGIVGPNTWNSLYDVFLGIAETEGVNVDYPGYALKRGSTGENVKIMQSYLNRISNSFDIPSVSADGIFGARTESAVKDFQSLQGITVDGIIGRTTWNRIVSTRLLI